MLNMEAMDNRAQQLKIAILKNLLRKRAKKYILISILIIIVKLSISELFQEINLYSSQSLILLMRRS